MGGRPPIHFGGGRSLSPPKHLRGPPRGIPGVAQPPPDPYTGWPATHWGGRPASLGFCFLIFWFFGFFF
jgi:hypothetical protein